MVKSRGEIQKAYRRRLKEENSKGYLASKQARRKRTYIPNDLLSSKSRDARNKKNREYIKLYRQRKKVAAQTVINPVENQDESFSTSGCGNAQSSTVLHAQAADNQNRLQVIRMNFRIEQMFRE